MRVWSISRAKPTSPCMVWSFEASAYASLFGDKYRKDVLGLCAKRCASSLW